MTEKRLSPLLRPHNATGTQNRKGDMRRQHAASIVEDCILRAHDRGRTCPNCEYCKAVTKARRTKFLCTFSGEWLA